MNKKSVLLIAFLMGVLLCGWGGFSLLAQTRAADGFPVRGKVTDEKGDGFAGVSVIIKGTNIGVDTDLSGSYQVFVPNSVQNPVIEFSFLGMKTQSFELTRKATVLNVEMKEDQNSIESAVVTGYGTIRKESFTGTSTTVSKADILKVSPNNLMKALSVYDPSVRQIVNNEMGSDPNTQGEFYIRGRSGVSEVKQLDQMTSSDVSEFNLKNNPSAPVFILDGFEVDATTIYDMDINRIESVTILKDAAATAVYGSRAANGVIVIESTVPELGAIRVSYSGNYSLSTPDLSSYDLMNAKELLEAEWLAGLYKYSDGSDNAAGLTNYNDLMNNVLRGADINWITKPLRNEFNHRHSIYLNGGTRDLRWGVDLNYMNNSGVMKGSGRDNVGGSVTVDYRFRGLQVMNKVSFNVNNSTNSPYGSFSQYYTMKPYLDPVDPETGAWVKRFSLYRLERKSSSSSSPVYVTNPLYDATLASFSKSGYKEFRDNLSLNWHISPFLLAKGTFSISYKNQGSDTFVDPRSSQYITTLSASAASATTIGSYTDTDLNFTNWNINGMLSYNRQIQHHNINATLGVEAAASHSQQVSASYRGFVEGAKPTPNNAFEIVRKPSYLDNNTRRVGTYLQTNYSFKDIYLLDVAARYEGNSSFGANKRMGLFWSGGAGINLHKFEFIKNLDVFEVFKIKATYGQTGKANFSAYQARTTYEMMTDAPYVDQWGMILKALGNENLLWEKVNKMDIGTEISMLDSRIFLGFDYYNERTIDQVESVSLPASSGFSSYMDNIGQVENRGVDIRLNVKAISTRDWDMYLFANANRNTNRILKLGLAMQEYNERIDSYFASYNSNTSNSNFTVPFTKYEVGNSLSAIYGMKSYGIDPATGQELYVNRDGSVTYTWSSAEQQSLGNSDPLLSGTLGFNLRWRNWTMYSTFAYRFGGQAYNATLVGIENADLEHYNADRRALTDRWTQVGDVKPLKAITDRTRVTRPTSRFVQDDNTFTFNTISLSYTFDRNLVKRWGLSNLRIQASTEDILYFSSIRRERGTSYPYARTFNLGLNITL